MAFYVVPSVQSLDFRGLYAPRSVDAASTVDVNLALDLTSQNIDGVPGFVDGNRILLKNQSVATQNGIYTIASGAGNTQRSTDMDTGTDASGVLILVKEGTTNGNTAWMCTNAIGSAVVGTNSLTFALKISSTLNGDLTQNTTQTLTNKDLTSATNSITCGQLQTTGTPVSISAATAPTVGQVLLATSATTATWQTSGGSGEANTASNVGTLGFGIFAQKSGVDLQFRTLSAGFGTTVVVNGAPNNDVAINKDETTIDNRVMIGPLSASRGGTGVTSVTNNTVIVTQGASAFTFKAKPGGTVLHTTAGTTNSLTNKTITDPSNTDIRVSSINSGGSRVVITVAAADTIGAIVRSSSATAATNALIDFPFTRFFQAASEAESTNNTTTDVQKLQLTANTVNANTYLLNWYVEYATDTASGSVAMSVTVTHSTANTVLAQATAQYYTGYGNSMGGQVRFSATSTSASYPCRIFFRSGTAGVTVRVRRARLMIWKD